MTVPLQHPVSALYFITVILLFAVVIGRSWREKPSFLRYGLLITVIPLFILHLFFGYIDELRGYYEALPFAFLLSLPTVARAISYSGKE